MSSTVPAVLLAMTNLGFAPQTPTPQEQAAVAATNGFGLALYRELAGKGDENLFLSPYSIAVAMTVAAEGARDQTAAEMLRVLHLPSPIGPAHTAFAALTQRLSGARGDATDATRERITTLRKELEAANKQAEELARNQKWEEVGAAEAQSSKLAHDLNGLLTTVDRYDLRVANALWVERTFDIVPDFVATIDRHYGTGGVVPMDFVGDAEGSRGRINAWIEEQTERRIRDLIPPGAITPLTGLVIGNAVWFRGEWAAPFETVMTRDEDFTLAGGKRMKARLMNERFREHVPYAAFDAEGRFFETPVQVPADQKEWPATYPEGGFTMIDLPYKGGDLAMTVLAPCSPDGLRQLESMLTAESLALWVGKMRQRTVHTAMLRFEQTAAFELSDVLQRLGMRRAFVNPVEPGGAQFGGISTAKDPARQVFIGSVRHKAWLSVDEKGTEAAAATAVMMTLGAAMPDRRMVPFIPEFRADRPFLYLIRDVRSGAVLFLGRVIDPRA